MPRTMTGSAETVRRFIDQPSEADPAGTWIELRAQLTYGERAALQSAAFGTLSAPQVEALAANPGSVPLDMYAARVWKIATYLHDWNILGPDGRPVRVPRDVKERLRLVEQLDEGLGSAIEAEINAFIAERALALAGDAEGNPTPAPAGGRNSRRAS